MYDTESGRVVCSNCRSEIKNDDDFCPECGTVFIEGINCINHKNTEAEGVCIICCEPFCKECGFIVNGLYFACNKHSEYEIYEGMARVYGSSDALQVEYIKKCLEEEGMHPVIYSRKASPLSLGAADYTLFRASGEYNGHIINEIKIMVPCQELIKAVEFIEKFNNENFFGSDTNP